MDKEGNSILKGAMSQGVDQAWLFNGGVGCIKINNEKFYIDRHGNILFTPPKEKDPVKGWNKFQV